MIRRLGTGILPVFALAVAILASGCGSDSTAPTPTGAAALVGSYDLVSLTFQDQPPLTPPAVGGTLLLADSTYVVVLTIPPDTTPATDSGKYTVSGNDWTQSSSVQQVQSVGTYTFTHDTLTVNVTTVNMQVSSVWKKRS